MKGRICETNRELNCNSVAHQAWQVMDLGVLHETGYPLILEQTIVAVPCPVKLSALHHSFGEVQHLEEKVPLVFSSQVGRGIYPFDPLGSVGSG